MVPGVSPVIVRETLPGLLPDPALEDGVWVPYAVVVPYSKRYVVGRPFGSTCPLSRAPVPVIEVAGVVVAPGGEAVKNVASAPLDVPAELTPTKR